MPSEAISPYRLFVWDGIAFELPADWNLAVHQTRGDVSRIEMEDDFAVRLEMEWTRTRRPLSAEKIRRSYDEQATDLRKNGAEFTPVTDLPPGWSAGLYNMSDGRRLLTAFHIAGDGLLCLFNVYFEKASFREPLRLIRHLASTFKLERGPVQNWAFLDLAFRLNSEFRLTGTAFDAGSKLLCFEWRRRRLLLWFFSPADVIAVRQPIEEWCAKVLNKYKDIRGPVFRPGPQPGELVWKREWRYPFGRFEDLYRHCHRYQALCRRLENANQILLTLFQYRTEADLKAPALELL